LKTVVLLRAKELFSGGIRLSGRLCRLG